MSSKLTAVSKIAGGSWKVLTGIQCSLGGGVLGTMFQSNHMTGCALAVGKQMVEDGKEQWKEGWEELNANRTEEPEQPQ